MKRKATETHIKLTQMWKIKELKLILTVSYAFKKLSRGSDNIKKTQIKLLGINTIMSGTKNKSNEINKKRHYKKN